LKIVSARKRESGFDMGFAEQMRGFCRLRGVLSLAALFLLLPSVLGAQQPPAASAPASKPAASGDSDAAAKNNRTRVVTNLAGFDLTDSKKLAGQPMVVGATRGANPVVPLAPHLGKLYGAHPTFAWSYDDTAAKFTFVISDESDVEVFRAEVSGTRFRYPANAPALQDGKTYFWTVSTPTSLVSSASSYPSGILVVTGAERMEIDKKLAAISGDTYEAGVARAQVLTDARLWYDAIDAYNALIERFPDRAELYERRGTIYAQLACTRSLAEDDLERTEKASDEKK
jgi:Domain of Unknown Function (DUF928)